MTSRKSLSRLASTERWIVPSVAMAKRIPPPSEANKRGRARRTEQDGAVFAQLVQDLRRGMDEVGIADVFEHGLADVLIEIQKRCGQTRAFGELVRCGEVVGIGDIDRVSSRRIAEAVFEAGYQ
ncbi:hypothetical protein F3087_26830 [Nocardia colli]|uniref:Uncharacterized protein n=1 Tax=Nocardia colli TaxID=2545717 RepID=A0A5N0E9V1_9NOCA|nr:hypothetical protein [Nocardia colli]KAA8886207.1 hypothetical protein F3087_26830 [Nocardia colli]